MPDYYTPDRTPWIIGVATAGLAVAIALFATGWLSPSSEAPPSGGRSEPAIGGTGAPSPSSPASPSPPAGPLPDDHDLVELFTDPEEVRAALGTALGYAEALATFSPEETESDYHDRLAVLSDANMASGLPSNTLIGPIYEELEASGEATRGNARIISLQAGDGQMHFTFLVTAISADDPEKRNEIGRVYLMTDKYDDNWYISGIDRFLH
ncbi:hypothetical protein GCM10027294_21480 [Marinactinospora endophytica]